MDKQDLDLLLQARTSELQHEYENLVRSLDAAYEAVKAIGRDIADNRAEARRLFDTRLKLARGDNLEAVLRLCDGSSSDAAVTATTDKMSHSNTYVATAAAASKVQSKVKCNDNGRKLANDQLMVRLYVQQQPSGDATITRQSRVVAVTPTVSVNESIPRLRPIKSTIQTYDKATLFIDQQQQKQQHQRHEQPNYSPVYVGDDHSYAVNEDEDEDEMAKHQLMLEERLMAEAGDAKRKRYRENHTGGVDLSIVKTESTDNSIDEQSPLVDHTNIVKPVGLTKNTKLAGGSSKRSSAKMRRSLESNVSGGGDDEISRKRKQTRERMRRWRAKRKMEETAKVIASTLHV